jgi:hypothetical protein
MGPYEANKIQMLSNKESIVRKKSKAIVKHIIHYYII